MRNAAAGLIIAGIACATVVRGLGETDWDGRPAAAAPLGEPKFAEIPDIPGLPRVLLIGDSITEGYFAAVRAGLRGRANVHFPTENCGSTEYGLARLPAWLGTGGWDVIHFNFGLHDLWRGKNRSGPVSENDPPAISLTRYEKNLRELVARLKATGASLIFANTTPVPADSYGRIVGDERSYNQVAGRVMRESGVAIDDLWSFVAPRQREIQLPHDVHFVRAGFLQIAGVVEARIAAALPSRPPGLLPAPPQPEKWAGRNLRVADPAMGLQWIPPGSFQMGSASGGYDDERPVATVHITRGFWIGRCEVTKKQWRIVMGGNPDYFPPAEDNLAVIDVSWRDATAFCRRLTALEGAAGRLPAGYQFRLPTEAEWEYACRAGSMGDYGGDGVVADMAWCIDTTRQRFSHPVGGKLANAWGLCDMHGNVAEWCFDWYGSYAGREESDPAGPALGALRVLRGGSWAGLAVICRSACRGWADPEDRIAFVGFRAALAPVIKP